MCSCVLVFEESTGQCQASSILPPHCLKKQGVEVADKKESGAVFYFLLCLSILVFLDITEMFYNLKSKS